MISSMKLNLALAGSASALHSSNVNGVEGAGDWATQENEKGQRVLGHGPTAPGSLQYLTDEEYQKVKEEVQQLIDSEGGNFVVPVRSFMEEKDMNGKTAKDFWRFGGPPDYTLANHAYLTGKTQNHKEGSLELIVENLVKTWEMERSHKLDYRDHQSTAPEFQIGANNGKMFQTKEANEVGNYNVLLDGIDKKLYDTAISNHKSHEVFKTAFQTFPWEVLQVFTGPPTVAFSWRHWGHFKGSYTDAEGTTKGKGELIEMFGFGTAEVNDKLQLKTVKVYFDGESFMKALKGQGDGKASGIAASNSMFQPPAQTNRAVDRMAGGCPFEHLKDACPVRAAGISMASTSASAAPAPKSSGILACLGMGTNDEKDAKL